MCGRFALTLPREAMLSLFEAAAPPGLRPESADGAALALPGGDPGRPRYNIRPTEAVLAVHRDEAGGRRLGLFRWGLLPHWAKSMRDVPPLINARGETIAEKPAFKSAFAGRRCLVPADGFYEWRTLSPADPDAGGKAAKPVKEPHWIHARARNAPLAFAGVWRVWRGPAGESVPSLALVTTAANSAMAALHERLPVVIAPEDHALWLGEDGDAAAAAALIRAPGEDFYAHHPVSPRINKGGRDAPDDADLIAPVAGAPDGPEQPTLF